MNTPQEAPKSVVRRIVKIVALIITIAIIAVMAVFAGVLIYVDANDEQIKTVIIQQLHDRVDADITINAADIELFRHFPDISVRLSGTTLSPEGYNPDIPPLAVVKSFFVRIDLLSVLHKTYHIESFLLEDADIVIYQSGKGKTNYDFLLQNNTSDSGTSIIPTISIPKLQLNRVNIRYINGNDHDITAEIATCGISITSRDSLLSINLGITAKTDLPGLQLPSSYSTIMAEARYNPVSGSYTIDGARLVIDDMTIYLSSDEIIPMADHQYRIEANSPGIDIQKVIKMLPEESTAELRKWNPCGTVAFSGTLNGDALFQRMPAMELTTTIALDSIQSYENNLSVYNIKSKAEAGYFPAHPEDFYLKLQDFSASLQHDCQSTGWIVIRNLNRLYINSALNTDVDFSLLSASIPELPIKEGNGNINLQYKGCLKDLQSAWKKELLIAEISTDFDLRNLMIAPEGKDPLRIAAIKGNATPRKANIPEAVLSYRGSDLTISGTMEGLTESLLSTNAKTVHASLSILSESFNIDNFLAEKNNSSTGNTFNINTLPGIDATISLVADDIIYHQDNFTDTKMDIRITDKDIFLNNIQLWHNKGHINATAAITDYRSAPLLKASVEGNSLDISKIFYICDNFGLEVLTDENISGSLTTDLHITSPLDSGFTPELSSLTLDANILIRDGRLHNFGPLTDFSGFLALDDLSDIQFETLENQIYIHNNAIIIPSMEVRNNVLDLSMEGKQGFDGNLDYHIDLALAELLSKKYNQKNPDSEFGVIQEDNRKQTRLYIAVSGTSESPKFRYDTPKARKAISKELEKERKEWQAITQQEEADSVAIPEAGKGFNIQWDKKEEEQDSVIRKVKKKKRFEIDW